MRSEIENKIGLVIILIVVIIAGTSVFTGFRSAWGEQEKTINKLEEQIVELQKNK
ncbi:MAG: hypothetical protein PHI88_02310 [Candidatus Pacebacteria bacterium]|nr:hypothetical protein [Candidatus Paceibacterota bacterium]